MGKFNIDPIVLTSLLKKFCIAKTAKDRLIDTLSLYIEPKGIMVKQTDESDTVAVIGYSSKSLFSIYPIKDSDVLTFDPTEIIHNVPRLFKKATSVEFKWDDENIYISDSSTTLSIPDVYSNVMSLSSEPSMVEIHGVKYPIYGDNIEARFTIDSESILKIFSTFSVKSIDSVNIKCEDNTVEFTIYGKKKTIKKSISIPSSIDNMVQLSLPIKCLMMSLSSLSGTIDVIVDDKLNVTLSEVSDKYIVHHILAPIVSS